jgi:hypothetical protein
MGRMTYVIAEPQLMASVAAEIEEIGSALSAANAAAAAPTSAMAVAAGDEVSAAVADMFGGFGQEYQALVAQFEAFHNQFQQTLAAAGIAYAETETAIAAGLQGALGLPNAPSPQLTAATIPPFLANEVSLFMGGTGNPFPSQANIDAANARYVRANGITQLIQRLVTPEQGYPLTGVKSLTLDASVKEGLTILDNTLYDQIVNQGKTVTVYGISQSAIISSLEMRNLAAGTSIFGANPPTADQLNFVLTGNEMNPNGGMFSRFPNLSLTALGLTFYGPTPADTIYPTAIYTQEYDGFADFPRYPLNFISDLNAVMGIAFVHTQYAEIPVSHVDSALQLPTSPGYTGNTSYFMIRTENLPLLTPLRAIPVIGPPLADLIQPDLKVIVNLGYGDPAYGFSTSYANEWTTFGLFPDVAPGTVVNALAAGTQQGIHDFSVDIQHIISQPAAAIPPLTLPAAPDPATTLANLPSPAKVVNVLTSIVSTDYAILLPTADIGLTFLTTVPAYDAELFVDQLAAGNLINAIGYPIAADVGLATVAGGVELLGIGFALASNVKDLQSLVP